MAPPFNNDQTHMQLNIDQKRARLLAIENDYIKTKHYLDSPEWGIKRNDVLLRIMVPVSRYQGKDPTEAVFILGQVKQMLNELAEVSDIIVEFESLRKQVNDYQAMMNG